jgi:uncharacterized protein YydD (DUF2326 family)
MKISKIYANNENFKTIVFDKGINFILSNEDGVGKSSLFKLIDFCLLGDKSFLGHEYFKDYIFYIELQIAASRYITIKRPIVGGKNIELKITKQKSMLLDEKDFNKKGSLGVAKSFFENKVNYSINKFRTYITYFLRDEDNQNDPLILNKYLSSTKTEYKTIISKLASNDRLIDSITKYGKMVLDKEVTIAQDSEFKINVKTSLEDCSVRINKLLCFIYSAALAEVYVQKRLIKFVAFDCPFDGEKNTYEDGIYRAIHELNRKGIQTIITSNEDDISNSENLLEIRNDYLTGYLTHDDKLMGEF